MKVLHHVSASLTFFLFVSFCLPLHCLASEDTANSLVVKTNRFQAKWSDGSLTELRDSVGHSFVESTQPQRGLSVHQIGAEFYATKSIGDPQLPAGKVASRAASCFLDANGKQTDEILAAESQYCIEQSSGDIVLVQQCQSKKPSTWGIGWTVGRIPLEYNLIIPGRSGIRLTSTTHGKRHEFDYPVGWEAQLIIIEGPDHGFYVWADDSKGKFKRLIVERQRDGWQLRFITINDAPFDHLTECQSVSWHINVYQGDWRVPARRYRQWATENFKPTPIADQKPSWIRDIRSLVVMPVNQTVLEALPTKLIPNQTMVYIYNWRAPGYDRDYPNYEDHIPSLQPFVKRAHELGFRVMLHANYFGVDPLHPAYSRFEPHQVRSAWGAHEKQWWLWTRADPEIKFAYINPALKSWRDYFTDQMVRLCQKVPVDSLHLDQTLVVQNDHNGRIDGMSMMEGNIELHRQLREALPHIALSGEGLNEITYRHEAFAQRHVWGIDHTRDKWDRENLDCAHPICSYLFRPFVIINGYLGCAPPSKGQLYAAWKEAYEHWGVIPTLKTSLGELRNPGGFARQFFDEAKVWQQHKLNIDMESSWPYDIAFPFRSEDGRRAVHTSDGRFLLGKQEISRVIKDVNQLDAFGTIPNWKAYDEHRLIGLDPSAWYPYFHDPRDQESFRVTALPESMIAKTIVQHDDMALVRIASRETVVADLVELIENAEVGSRPFEGQPIRLFGSSTTADGAQFSRINSEMLTAHPPWKAKRTDPQTGEIDQHGTGIAYARYAITLPNEDCLEFRSQVKMDKASVGNPQSDGATFQCTARSGDIVLQESTHHDSDTPKSLSMDLTSLAGREVVFELALTPGPKQSPSFDWARWIRPRIESRKQRSGQLNVAGLPSCRVVIDGNGPIQLKSQPGQISLNAALPGSIFFLDSLPESIEPSTDLVEQKRWVIITDSVGHEIKNHKFAGTYPTVGVVGGVSHPGWLSHPPDFGCTENCLPMTLPEQPTVLRSWIGIRDGGKSTGVIFRIEINGQVANQQPVLPGKWHPVEVDLAPWRGKTIVLSLVVDSNGPHDCDWACWGEPRIEAK